MKTVKSLFRQMAFVNAIKIYLFEISRRLLNRNVHLSYSQIGEDIIIQDILQKIDVGFYVEVGSNEPIQHSNTFGLYSRGWHGITIDANNEMIKLHKEIRPKDIALCAAISNVEEDVTFYEFDMDEISTISKEFHDKNVGTQRIVKETIVRTRTLDSVLEEYMGSTKSIDLLSIDVEGHDLNVLKSINLREYRPKLIIIEIHDFSLTKPDDNEIYKLMIENDYILIGYAIWNGYFVDKMYEVNK